MKIKIERRALLDGMNIVSKAVNSGGTLPVLKCALLAADENGLKLSANDLELAIETAYIDADVSSPGSVALDAKLFSDIIKKLPEDYVIIESDEKNATKIKCGKFEFKLMGDDASTFPEIPTVERETKLSIDRCVLKDMIAQTVFSVSYDETKPILTGELIEIADGNLKIVSVDGFRASYRFTSTVSDVSPYKTVVPGKAMSEVAKLLALSDTKEVNMFFSKRHVLFELETCKVVTRVIEGEYMDYAKPLFSEYTTLVMLDRNIFLASLDRATLAATGSLKKIPVKLEICKDSVKISANSELATVSDEIPAVVDGEGLKIAFNPRYLMEALKAIDDKEIAMQYNSSLTPCVIRPVEDGNYRYLVLPLRLSGNTP